MDMSRKIWKLKFPINSYKYVKKSVIVRRSHSRECIVAGRDVVIRRNLFKEFATAAHLAATSSGCQAAFDCPQ